LLAEKDGLIEVIQCKHWARRKTIHEKHVLQLFGTVVAARIENPGLEVTGTFTTTTKLSERAHAFADQLDIKVEEDCQLADYPRVKCNISRSTGERIYHLAPGAGAATSRLPPSSEGASLAGPSSKPDARTQGRAPLTSNHGRGRTLTGG
jgi:hypothetical protein